MSICNEAIALEAELEYVADVEPGITRRRHGKGFAYRTADGKPVAAAHAERIRLLAIPPAWTNVWICISPNGHIQATGRDKRGRKQYCYHVKWSQLREQQKYTLLPEFVAALPRLREQVDADLRRRGLPREKVLASVAWLLDNTMIRVGNDAYAEQNRSFGLTTLRSRHVEISGTTLHFEFMGKSGQDWELDISDRRIARVMRSIQELPGQRLFQYLDEEGKRQAVASQDVNLYIQDAIGEEFTSKHFRTWGGSIRALNILTRTEVPQTKTGRVRVLNKAIDKVARRLGNTRAVCRKCYIHPAIIHHWETGNLAGQVTDIRRRRPRRKGLDAEEVIALRWLEAHAPHTGTGR